MAFADSTWYCSFGNGTSTGYFAVAQFAVSTAYTAGQLVRQLTAPAVGSERVFVVIVAGTSSTEPSWTVTRGAKNTSGTVTFQECTGASAVNGDLTNTPTWSGFRAISTAVTLGAIIQRNNGASYWICSTAGSVGASEPAWSNNTAGTTQTDSTVTWTCLGVVGSFTGGQAPHARLANACTASWFAAGNTIYVGDNHAESQTATITIAPGLSATTMSRILCYNHSGSYPPASSDLRTTATISTTAAASINFNPTSGSIYVYGLSFGSAGAAFGMAGGNSYVYFDNCLFKQASSTPFVLTVSSQTNFVIWNNCTVYVGSVGSYLDVDVGTFIWQNTGQIFASGSLIPNNLLGAQVNSKFSNITLEALDLSQVTGNINNINAPFQMGTITIKDCKLSASLSAQAMQAYGQIIQFVRCDNGATGYKSARYTYEGTETTETSITRVGGASDPTGQAQSRKIVTTANSQWLRPFKAEPYAIWNPTTGANVTVTVCGTVNAGALPNNDDIWLEVEYLGSAASPLGTILSTTKSNLLAANAAVASDSSTWNNANPNSTAFDPTSVSNTTLSNGNLTATHSNTTGNSGAQVSVAQSSGKWYFEVTQATTGHGLNDIIAGIVPIGSGYSALSTAAVGAAVNRGGTILAYNVTTGIILGAFSAGDVCGVAVDFGAGLVWFRKNAGNWNNSGTANPVTGVGGVSINLPASLAPSIGFTGSGTAAGDSYTANFGATSYANAAPSGFGNWVSFTPFKLTTTLSAPQPGLAGYLHARVRAGKASTTYYIDPMVVLS